jgi:hypothetical protein
MNNTLNRAVMIVSEARRLPKTIEILIDYCLRVGTDDDIRDITKQI